MQRWGAERYGHPSTCSIPTGTKIQGRKWGADPHSEGQLYRSECPVEDMGSVNGEVLDGGFSVDEVSVVFGIEDGLVNVFSPERFDRLAIIPEADR